MSGRNKGSSREQIAPHCQSYPCHSREKKQPDSGALQIRRNLPVRNETAVRFTVSCQSSHMLWRRPKLTLPERLLRGQRGPAVVSSSASLVGAAKFVQQIMGNGWLSSKIAGCSERATACLTAQLVVPRSHSVGCPVLYSRQAMSQFRVQCPLLARHKQTIGLSSTGAGGPLSTQVIEIR